MHLLRDSLSDTPPCCVKLFFLFSNAGRGNEVTVAAGLTEIPSEGEQSHNTQVDFSLQKVGNKTKVRDCICFVISTQNQSNLVRIIII